MICVYLVFLFVLTIVYKQHALEMKNYDEVTPGIQDRIKDLKQLLRQQIQQQQHNVPGLMPLNDKSDDIDPHLEYEASKEGPVTPIANDDERKFKDRFKFKPLVSKYTTTAATMPETEEYTKKQLRSKKKHKHRPHFNIPSEIFYRRWQGRDDSRNHPVKWLHCMELLTPYLYEGKNVASESQSTGKLIAADDPIVLRLLQLIGVPTKSGNMHEIYSILMQISNISIRLYQWSDEAVMVLINQIIDGKIQNFKTLKSGLKRLFAKWHMDISNTTALLQQTRIFRPPCIQVSELSGSTKTSNAVRYTRKGNKKRTPCPHDEDPLNSCEVKPSK